MGYVEKDYLLRYFNQLGVVIAKILGLKKKGQFEEARKVIENSLLDFGLKSLDTYLEIDVQDLIIELIRKHKLNNGQIKVLAELLFEKAEIENEDDNLNIGIPLYSRALILYNYLTSAEKVYSFEREKRISLIRAIINS